MSKVYKVEMYICDINDSYTGIEEIINDIENSNNAVFKCFNVETVNLDWHDDIDINHSDCDVKTYRKYFKDKKLQNIYCDDSQCIHSKNCKCTCNKIEITYGECQSWSRKM